MNWSDLRIFLAISRTGTLGAAGRHLGLTQPTMGRRLRALEAETGHSLFQRTSDGFVLTDEGQALLAPAERMEEAALSAERILSGGDALSGLIRVSSSDWFGLHVLTPVFTEFIKVHPGLSLELVTDARLFSLARREADIAFRISPFMEPEIIQRKLLRMEYAFYGSRDWSGDLPEDGDGLSLVTMDTSFGNLPDMLWLQRKLPRARIAYRSNNRDVQARACAMGAGFAVLPRPLGDSMRELRVFHLGESPPGRDVWVGYHRDLKRMSRLRALLDFTLQRLA